SDSESDREWQRQTRSGGQRCPACQWASHAVGDGAWGDGRGETGGFGQKATERESAGVAARLASPVDGQPAVRAAGTAPGLGRVGASRPSRNERNRSICRAAP